MGLFSLCVIFIMISVVLAVVGWVIGFGDLVDEESSSSFECGFISFQGARLSFSLQFFLIAMVFLVFDVEIALILPLPVVVGVESSLGVGFIFLLFFLVVLGGLYYEWGVGVLDWAY